MTDKTMPPLPSGSVDLDALHKSAAAGGDLAKAIEKATIRVEAAPAAKPAKPASPARTGAVGA